MSEKDLIDTEERGVYGEDIYLNHYEHTAILVAFAIVREGKERAIAETKAHSAGKYSISKKIMQKSKREWYEGLEKAMKHLERKMGTDQLKIWGYSNHKRFS